jgi:hypothetical protein
MKIFPLFLLISLSFRSFAGQEKTFDSSSEHAWAETPKGKFECISDKTVNYNQILRLAGKEIYHQKGPSRGFGSSIDSGISSEEGCFNIIESKNGVLLIIRSIQPPHYQVENIAVLDFNSEPINIFELGIMNSG